MKLHTSCRVYNLFQQWNGGAGAGRLAERAMFLRCRQRFGGPRLLRELRDAGLQITEKSVAKTRREDCVGARRPTPCVRATDLTHAGTIAARTAGDV